MRRHEIKWEYGEKIDKKKVEYVEQLFGIKFPEKYVEIILEHDGAQPDVKDCKGEWKEGVVDIPNWGPTTFGFLSFEEDSEGDIKIIYFYEIDKEVLPEPDKIFPFANDGGGNTLFFDYRNNSKEPAIVFQDHEEIVLADDLLEEDLKAKSLKEWQEGTLYHVCDSFEELLDSIYPEEEE